MKLELCTESIESLDIAVKYNLDRIELCSALELGGLTPGIGLIQAFAAQKKVGVHVLIRPRPGNFIYSENEILIMEADIKQSARSGARGVVFGCLNKLGGVDLDHNLRLISHAKSSGLETTYHRAFDFCINPIQSMEEIISLGFDRLLTSGQKATAFGGLALLNKLVIQSSGRIQIMAGGGINSKNVLDIERSGVDAVHFSAYKPLLEKEIRGMGKNTRVDEEKIQQIKIILRPKRI